MCVICVSPKGKRQPNADEIKKMFRTNSDGAGIAYVRGGIVNVEKGFDTVEKYLNRIEELKFTDDTPVIYHMRISTQGPSLKMTHPFPVVYKDKNRKLALDDLEKTRTQCEVAMAHNGIIHGYSTGDKRFSDTALFIFGFAQFAVRNKADLSNEFIVSMLEREVGSYNRLAFITSSGDIVTVGSWEDCDGLTCSNSHWNTKYSYSTLYSNYGSANSYYGRGNYYSNGYCYGYDYDDDDDYFDIPKTVGKNRVYKYETDEDNNSICTYTNSQGRKVYVWSDGTEHFISESSVSEYDNIWPEAVIEVKYDVKYRSYEIYCMDLEEEGYGHVIYEFKNPPTASDFWKSVSTSVTDFRKKYGLKKAYLKYEKYDDDDFKEGK